MKTNRKLLGIPYALFLLIFVVIPLFVIVRYAFTDGTGSFSFHNLNAFFGSKNTIGTLVYSLAIALVTTLVCLLLGYPLAYVLARSKMKGKGMILLLFVMPMWINFTLRITALKEVLTLLEGNLSFHPFLNSVIGMTYDFLPFMLLPMYNALSRLDESLIEASHDLGAGKRQTFIKVILPLSVPGIISGVIMVFLPSMTNYVVLDMLYNKTYIMGSLIGAYFSAYDWHNGSMISLVLLALIAIITLISNRYGEDEEKGGVVLDAKKN